MFLFFFMDEAMTVPIWTRQNEATNCTSRDLQRTSVLNTITHRRALPCCIVLHNTTWAYINYKLHIYDYKLKHDKPLASMRVVALLRI
jgi:hypothetical protein